MPFVLGGKLPVRGNSGTSRPIRYSGSGTLFSTAYSYQNISDTQTTPRVRFRNVRVGDSGTLLEGKRYEYDALGNITRISQSVSPYYPLVEYSYDSQNQLIKETYYDGSGTGTAHVTDYYDYTYDTAGNLLTAAKTGTVTQTYTYGNSDWRDLLTAVNGNGITYDNGGNPLRYGGWNFDWQNGRELVKAEQSDGAADTTLTYAYDADGIRTSKTYKVETYEAHYTVKFVADGVTVKTMTVNDGYTLTDSDYPTVPAKSGYNGTWQQHTAAIHSDITVQAVYTQIRYTVTFVADGATVKTMTVNDGYVLQDEDYPAAPEKDGFTGAWQPYTEAIHFDVTIQAAYTVIQHTVTFVADRTTVKTMTVTDGYVLQDSDYPTVPTKVGHTAAWQQYTEAIHSDVTVRAVYTPNLYTVTFIADGVTVKTMTVKYGYSIGPLNSPDVPEKEGYLGRWDPLRTTVRMDTVIRAVYTKTDGGGGNITVPSVKPTSVIMPEDLPEPIEPQDVVKPEDNGGTNAAEALSSRPNQTLISTQTITHEYLTLSGKVARETVKKNGSVTDVMDFVYDESGRPFALNHSTNGGSSFTTYYYILNLQGDVVKLVTASGSSVATYEYDAWGNILSKSGTMADKNPLRYRGYYYDNETGFYYLQSRYYDPVNRRFINADSYASTGQGFAGTNMYAYCNNNPVIYADPTGAAADPRFNTTAICDGSTLRKMSFWEMIKECITAYGGIGMGIEAQTTVLDIGFTVGMHGDFGALTFSDGEFTFGQRLQVGASASIPGVSASHLDISEREMGGELKERKIRGIDETETSITIFSVSAYLIAGATIEIGFDLGKFFGLLRKYV